MILLIALSVVAILAVVGYLMRDAPFMRKLMGAEASDPYDIASASGVEIFGTTDDVNYRGTMQEIETDQEARVLMEGAASGRPEPRLSVAEIVDFQRGATQPGVGAEEEFEGSNLYPGSSVNPVTLDIIEQAPHGVMRGASADEEFDADELVNSEVYGDETPLTEQGHAGGIIPISLAMQTNYAKQDPGSAYQLLTGWTPEPSAEECKHLCLDGGAPAYVDLCDCSGYIEPLTGLGPLERRPLRT